MSAPPLRAGRHIYTRLLMVVRVLWNRYLNEVLAVVSVQLGSSTCSSGRRQSLIKIRRWLLDAYD